MVKGNFIYVNWEQVNHLVISNGISDADFVNGLPEIPRRIVLIDGQNDGDQFNAHTRFQTVNGQAAVRQFLLAHTPHPKMWLDFHQPEDLDLLMPSEIGELLYMVHMKTHLHVPLYAKLQNDYTYLTISPAVRAVYYRYLTNFGHVFDVAVKRHLRAFYNSRWTMFNRTLAVSDVPMTVFNQIALAFSEGVLMGFDRIKAQPNQYCIPLFVQENPELPNWQSDPETVYDTTQPAATLTYFVNEGRWELTIVNSWPFENNEHDL